MKRIELSTSSLPRKCSTPELQRLVKSRDLPYTSLSGRRGSNPRPTAWKAVALPTELLPLFKHPASAQAENAGLHPDSAQAEDTGRQTRGQGWIRTTELVRGQIYSLLPLATWLLAHIPGEYSPLRSQRRDSNPRPADYKSAALPTELLWLVTLFARRSSPYEGGPPHPIAH